MKRIFLAWTPFMFLLTFASILAYASVQQVIRMNANDPQIQIAEDDQARIEDYGAGPQTVVGTPVDIEKSLAPFVIVYDESGAAVASSGLLKGIIPVPPKGVFEYLRSKNENRFTWEPEAGIRNAVVMRRISGSRPGFILVGRSMREIETRLNSLEFMIAGFWFAGMIITFLYSLYVTRPSR
ncbi:hypothetical protein BH11PAT3_BH11PAT3_2710 [soil metagenome]